MLETKDKKIVEIQKKEQLVQAGEKSKRIRLEGEIIYMKVKELIEQLQKYDAEQEVIIRFALDEDDEIGYILEPFDSGLYFKDECAIYAEYTATKEDCDFIGQVDLKEAYQKIKEE